MSERFLKHSGVAAVLMRDNIDTDQIIPSREMKSVSREGLADGLFAGWRYADPELRIENPEFVLNHPTQKGSSVLISGRNFGCGSSREHAVWALKEYGIRAIIAESFGEIFHGNCLRNGVLPIVLDQAQIKQLSSLAAPVMVEIDLEAQTLSCPELLNWLQPFQIGSFAKRLLTLGLDPIELTLKSNDEIEDFFSRDQNLRPWVYSAA